jgi:hypothetical protein
VTEAYFPYFYYIKEVKYLDENQAPKPVDGMVAALVQTLSVTMGKGDRPV